LAPRWLLDDVPSEDFSYNAFTLLSRRQANVNADVITTGLILSQHTGAFNWVSSNHFATLGLAEPPLRTINKALFVQPTPHRFSM
jgi:hypothetical protein